MTDGMKRAVEQFIENVCLDVAELPDRTSPDDQPEWMLVSAEELESCLRAHLPILLAMPLVGVAREDVARTAAAVLVAAVQRWPEFSRDVSPSQVIPAWDGNLTTVANAIADAVLASPRAEGAAALADITTAFQNHQIGRAEERAFGPAPQAGCAKEGSGEPAVLKLLTTDDGGNGESEPDREVGLSAGSPVPSQQAAQVAFDRAGVLRRAADSMDAQERRDRRDDEDLSRMADDMRRGADLADEIGNAILSVSPPLPVAEREWQPIETAMTVLIATFQDAYGWRDNDAQQAYRFLESLMNRCAAPPLLAEQGETR